MLIIPIDKERIPYTFSVQIHGTTRTFTVKYNSDYDYFTLDLIKDGQPVVEGEKIMLHQEIFSSIATGDLPRDLFVTDLSDEAARCGWEELSETVFIYILTGETV